MTERNYMVEINYHEHNSTCSMSFPVKSFGRVKIRPTVANIRDYINANMSDYTIDEIDLSLSEQIDDLDDFSISAYKTDDGRFDFEGYNICFNWMP